MRYRFFYWVVMLGLLVYSAWVSRFYAADETSLKTIYSKNRSNHCSLRLAESVMGRSLKTVISIL